MSKHRVQWFVRVNANELGPFSEKQIRQQFAAGSISNDAQIRQGSSPWIDAGIVKARFQELDANGWYVSSEDGKTLGPLTHERFVKKVRDRVFKGSTMIRKGKLGEWKPLSDAVKESQSSSLISVANPPTTERSQKIKQLKASCPSCSQWVTWSSASSTHLRCPRCSMEFEVNKHRAEVDHVSSDSQSVVEEAKALPNEPREPTQSTDDRETASAEKSTRTKALVAVGLMVLLTGIGFLTSDFITGKAAGDRQDILVAQSKIMEPGDEAESGEVQNQTLEPRGSSANRASETTPGPSSNQFEPVKGEQASDKMKPNRSFGESEQTDSEQIPQPDAPTRTIPNDYEPTRYAFLVGVKNYDKRELTSLKYTEKDVTDLANTLKSVGYDEQNIVLMTQSIGANEARFLPESVRIRSELQLLLSTMYPGDSVLVAFSGHGIQFASDPKNYFCPMDARLSEPDSLISLTEIYKALNQSKATTKFMLVDACRNDPESTLAKAVRKIQLEPVVNRRPEVPSGGITALFSCSATEQSFEDPELENGVFLHYVNEGLQGLADQDSDQQVSIPELFQFVSKTVQARVRNEIGVNQTPELKGEFRGVTVLASLLPSAKSEEIPRQEQSKPQDAMVAIELPDPKDLPPAIHNILGMQLNLIPAGTFEMGSDLTDTELETIYGPEESVVVQTDNQPKHTVQISNHFYMATTEVTQSQWKKVMGSEPWISLAEKTDYKKEVNIGASYPVTGITWQEAVGFCKKLSRLDGRAYLLPTEAQWEYACRANTTTEFSFGDSVSDVSQYAHVYRDSRRLRRFSLTRCGSNLPNSFGLFDMHGNASEWCMDWYADDYYGRMDVDRQDPTGPDFGQARVIRGGNVEVGIQNCNSSSRSKTSPLAKDVWLGIRVISPHHPVSDSDPTRWTSIGTGLGTGCDITVVNSEVSLRQPETKMGRQKRDALGASPSLKVESRIESLTQHSYFKVDLSTLLADDGFVQADDVIESVKLLLSVDAPVPNPRGGLKLYATSQKTGQFWIDHGPQSLTWASSPSSSDLHGLRLLANLSLAGNLESGALVEFSSPELGEFVRSSFPGTVTFVVAPFEDTPELSFASSESDDGIEPTLMVQLRHKTKKERDLRNIESGQDVSETAKKNIPPTFRNSVGMAFRSIKPARFMMGSARNQHEVQISHPFFLSITEVTQGQWESVMGTAPWATIPKAPRDANYPATMIEYDQAREFCRQLSAKENRCYDLPTEAQWEFVCRTGTQTEYSFGDDDNSLEQFCWFRPTLTTPVGYFPFQVAKKRANKWGFYDMYGNVAEWCLDGYRANLAQLHTAVDPVARSESSGVARGGSFVSLANDCRSSSRKKSHMTRKRTIGFRVALTDGVLPRPSSEFIENIKSDH